MAEQGRCKTCKWFFQEFPKDEGLWSHCGNPSLTGGNDGANDGIAVYGDSLPVTVGPDFGCIHHEAKDSNHA